MRSSIEQRSFDNEYTPVAVIPISFGHKGFWRRQGLNASQVVALYVDHRLRHIIHINNRLHRISLQADALVLISDAAICVDEVMWLPICF